MRAEAPAIVVTITDSADRVLAFVRDRNLVVDWILETHPHADHMTAAAYLKRETGAKVAIGQGITRVQERFRELFGLGPEFAADVRQFDRLLAIARLSHDLILQVLQHLLEIQPDNRVVVGDENA